MSPVAESKQPPFADYLGIKITHISPERVTGELAVRGELATMPEIIHGGAIMALADNIGAAMEAGMAAMKKTLDRLAE